MDTDQDTSTREKKYSLFDEDRFQKLSSTATMSLADNSYACLSEMSSAPYDQYSSLIVKNPIQDTSKRQGFPGFSKIVGSLDTATTEARALERQRQLKLPYAIIKAEEADEKKLQMLERTGKKREIARDEKMDEVIELETVKAILEAHMAETEQQLKGNLFHGGTAERCDERLQQLLKYSPIPMTEKQQQALRQDLTPEQLQKEFARFQEIRANAIQEYHASRFELSQQAREDRLQKKLARLPQLTLSPPHVCNCLACPHLQRQDKEATNRQSSPLKQITDLTQDLYKVSQQIQQLELPQRKQNQSIKLGFASVADKTSTNGQNQPQSATSELDHHTIITDIGRSTTKLTRDDFAEQQKPRARKQKKQKQRISQKEMRKARLQQEFMNAMDQHQKQLKELTQKPSADKLKQSLIRIHAEFENTMQNYHSQMQTIEKQHQTQQENQLNRYRKQQSPTRNAIKQCPFSETSGTKESELNLQVANTETELDAKAAQPQEHTEPIAAHIDMEAPEVREARHEPGNNSESSMSQHHPPTGHELTEDQIEPTNSTQDTAKPAEAVSKNRELDEKTFNEFLDLISGKMPQCVQAVARNKRAGKIMIMTTTQDNDDYKEFLRLTHEYRPFFQIKTVPAFQLFTRFGYSGVAFANSFDIGEKFKLGGMLFVQYQHNWGENEDPFLDRNFDRFYDREFQIGEYATPVWSSGPLLRDTVSNRIYLATTFHSVNEFLALQKVEFGLCAPRLLFQSAVLSEDGKKQVMIDVTDKYHGFYGSYFNDSDRPDMMDTLLLEITDQIQTDPRADLTHYDHENQKLKLDIYKGDIHDLKGVDVAMTGLVSGKRKGKIVDVNMFFPQIEKQPCKSLFVVALAEGEDTTKSENFAQPGDSGSLIYGRHPLRDETVAIGVVQGGVPFEWTVESTDVTYEHLTMCIPLQNALQFWKELGLELEMHCPGVENFIPEEPTNLAIAINQPDSLHWTKNMNKSQLQNTPDKVLETQRKHSFGDIPSSDIHMYNQPFEGTLAKVPKIMTVKNQPDFLLEEMEMYDPQFENELAKLPETLTIHHQADILHHEQYTSMYHQQLQSAQLGQRSEASAVPMDIADHQASTSILSETDMQPGASPLCYCSTFHPGRSIQESLSLADPASDFKNCNCAKYRRYSHQDRLRVYDPINKIADK